jgi:predicted metal-dependent enzyme (double-stranded beta helix superfamily)
MGQTLKFKPNQDSMEVIDLVPIRLDAVEYQGELPPSLKSLFSSLENISPFSHEEITKFLINLSLQAKEVSSIARFDPEKYARIRLHDGENFEVLMLCWLQGQRTRIHDHSGSLCAVKVLQGIGNETIYMPVGKSRSVKPVKRISIANGSVTVSRDADIHSLGVHVDSKDPLITLHVYSPPLRTTLPYNTIAD